MQRSTKRFTRGRFARGGFMSTLQRRAVHGAALILFVAAPAALGQTSAVDEIAKYRAALQDGNPAELWEARGEDLWKQKRGPKNVSLEQCDLGQGPGVVKGAYAQLPKYFADADRVQDLETRLVWCMVTLQGYSETDARKGPFGGPGKKSDIEALVAYVHLRAARGGRHVGNERLDIGLLAGAAEWALPRVGLGIALQGDHAPDESRFEILDAIGIGEVLRQLRVGALDHSGALPQIALFERDVLRTALLLPQIFAARFPKLGGIAILQRCPVLGDFIDGARLPQRCRSRDEQNQRSAVHGAPLERTHESSSREAPSGEALGGSLHADDAPVARPVQFQEIVASSVRLSPLLSTHVIWTLSPLAPPLNLNAWNGFFATA